MGVIDMVFGRPMGLCIGMCHAIRGDAALRQTPTACPAASMDLHRWVVLLVNHAGTESLSRPNALENPAMTRGPVPGTRESKGAVLGRLP